MRFYTGQHTHYCGIDLHTRMMYLCILDERGDVVLQRQKQNHNKGKALGILSHAAIGTLLADRTNLEADPASIWLGAQNPPGHRLSIATPLSARLGDQPNGFGRAERVRIDRPSLAGLDLPDR